MYCNHRHSSILYLSQVPEHSGTRLGTLISVPDWFRHQHFCSYRYRTDWTPDSPTFRHLKKGYTLHVHTACVGGGERDTPCTSIDSCCWCYSCSCYDIENSYVNAGMPEKVSPTSAFLPVVSCLSPASAIQHQGSFRYRWSLICPALPSFYCNLA